MFSLPPLINQTVLCSVRDFHSSVASAAERCQQLMRLDRSNNLTLLIVSHRPVANGIPAIRGLWWSSSLCTPALPFYIPSLSIWHTLCQQQLIMCLPNPAKKNLQYKWSCMINGEKNKGIWGVRLFLLFEDSLITENITLWNASEDCRPLHFPSDDRGLVHMTGSGTCRGSLTV